MSIELRGIEELQQRLTELADKETVVEGLKDCCMVVERSAKQKAKKGATGDLRNTIESKVEGLEGVVFSPLEYAPYVEYGTGLFAEGGGRTDVPWHYQDEQGDWHTTSGQHPQPFMRPALDENREKVIEILRRALLNG